MAKIKGLKKVGDFSTFIKGVVFDNHFQEGRVDDYNNTDYGCGVSIPKSDTQTIDELTRCLEILNINPDTVFYDNSDSFIIWLKSKKPVQAVNFDIDLSETIVQNGDCCVLDISIIVYELKGEKNNGFYINNVMVFQKAKPKTAREVFKQANINALLRDIPMLESESQTVLPNTPITNNQHF